MDNRKKCRHELKFAISNTDYRAIRSRIMKIMQPDPHADEDGRYRIRSLYFDNSDDKALMEKINGVAKREKFRIRYYNDDLSFITLEKKMKINDLCLKYDAPISEKEFRMITENDIAFMKEHDEELVRELYAKMKYQRLRPRAFVSYVREPYIYRPGNVRVTFDSQVRTSVYANDFRNRDVWDISATDTPEDMLLEVKFDAFLPEIIQDMIQLNNTRQQAFSKYGVSRRFG